MRDMFRNVTEPTQWTPRKLVSIVLVAIVFALSFSTWSVQRIMASEEYPVPPRTEILVHVIKLMPPTPPPPTRRAEVKKTEVKVSDVPTEAPTGVKPEEPKKPDEPDTTEGPGTVTGGDNNEIFKPEVEQPPPPAPTKPLVVGGQIRRPMKTRDVRPMYPSIAQAARVQGIVIIECTIGADGAVVDAKVLRSVPLLDEAALTAVRQWVFTPTLLNGVPHPVVMTVTVQFNLQ